MKFQVLDTPENRAVLAQRRLFFIGLPLQGGKWDIQHYFHSRDNVSARAYARRHVRGQRYEYDRWVLLDALYREVE